MTENRDMQLISGDFTSPDLPPEKRYLIKYFASEIQRAFLSYYIVFGHHELFMDHTGIYCTKRWVRKMRDRFVSVTKAYKKAQKEFDLDALAIIEKGEYKMNSEEEKQ